MKKLLEKFSTFSKRTNVVRSTVTVCVLLVAALVNALLYSLTTLYGLYLYQPKAEEQQLSETAELVLAPVYDVEGGVTVTFCMPREELREHDTGKLVLQTVELLEERFSDILSFRFINIITKMDEDGKYFDITPYTADEDGNELTVLKTSVIFESSESFRVLTSTTFEDFYSLDGEGSPVAYCGEEVFLSMILWVTKSTHPTAYFTTSHSELTDSTFARALAASGYKISTVNLRREDVPDDCALLIISNPQSDFERSAEGSGVVAEMDRLYAYANGGGDLYVSLDPYLKARLPVLEAFLLEYGISISRTEIDGESYPNVVRDDSQAITTDGYTLVGRFADTGLGASIGERVGAFRDGEVLLSRCAALTLSDGAEPLLLSSASSQLYASGQRVGSDGSYVLAASATRTAEDGASSSLFVVPSIYMTASDAMLSNTYTNKEFIYGLFEMLYGVDGSMPYGARAFLDDTELLENLTLSSARLYTLIALVPAIAALGVGIVVLTKRKYR